jgi:WD40 repeat protein
LAYSPDGSEIAVGATMAEWASGRHPEVRRELRGHSDAVRTVCFTPDGKQIASADDGGEILVWDLKNGEAIRSLVGHRGPVRAVAFRPDAKVLFSGGKTGPSALERAAGEGRKN